MEKSLKNSNLARRNWRTITKKREKYSECIITAKNKESYGRTLKGIRGRFDSYLSHYQYIFRNKTKIFYDKARFYAVGILLSKHNNIERISEEAGMNYHQLQHFITESTWDHRQLIDEVSTQVSQCLPKRKLTGLIIRANASKFNIF